QPRLSRAGRDALPAESGAGPPRERPVWRRRLERGRRGEQRAAVRAGRHGDAGRAVGGGGRRVVVCAGAPQGQRGWNLCRRHRLAAATATTCTTAPSGGRSEPATGGFASCAVRAGGLS